MLGQYLQQWPNINPTFAQHVVPYSLHARGVQPMLGQCRRRWADIDLTLVPEFYN